MNNNIKNLSAVRPFFILVILVLSFQGCSNASDEPSSPLPIITPEIPLETPPITEDEKVAAAIATAQNNSNCSVIAPFYWEIGDQNSIRASGKTGDGSVARTTRMPIGSASKWLFGIYVIQKLNGVLSEADRRLLRMTSGFTSFSTPSCMDNAVTSVQECFDAANNSRYNPLKDGLFSYGGGHFQKLAVDLGLGPLRNSTLAADFKSQFGSDVDLTFTSPQLAGGMAASAGGFALILQRVLSGQLIMKNFLGSDPICTLPSACPQASNSPVPENFHYSYGHWVEDSPESGDGSFNSSGVFGFYPWIDASKTYYGVVARYKTSAPTGDDIGNEIGEGWNSYLCGRLIRKAYFSGQAQ